MVIEERRLNSFRLFLISSITLSGRYFRLRSLFPILCQRSPHIRNFIKLPSVIAAHITFICARIDQLS